jgi:recombination protein RecR
MYEGPVQDLIEELGRLPGVGPKSAQRIAFHLLTVDAADAERLAGAIRCVREKVRFCQRCFNVAEAEECRICRDARRDPALLCVVEEPRDLIAIEKTNEFRGRYHVLGGAISPIDGIGPDQLHVKELLVRIAEEGVSEVVIATNPNIEGEATASYLARLLKELSTPGQPLRVSRIASGLPVGGDLEYADEVTLGRAFAGRRDV